MGAVSRARGRGRGETRVRGGGPERDAAGRRGAVSRARGPAGPRHGRAAAPTAAAHRAAAGPCRGAHPGAARAGRHPALVSHWWGAGAALPPARGIGDDADVSTPVRHPIFARLYAKTSPSVEAKGAAAHRDELLAGLAGRVVEVGAGNGLNFAHYPAGVTEVVAVEPEPYLRARAREAAADAAVAVTVVDGIADALPAPDGAFDAAVASLVLCSVPDQASALREVRRVLRAGGELRFYEHVVAERPRAAAVMRALDRSGIWPRLAGGCHAARDTPSAIERAGFVVERMRRFQFAAGPVAVPHVIGVARRG